jgi:anti-sigma B factor antagonist
MSSPHLTPTFAIHGSVALIAFAGELEVTTAPRAGAQLHALLAAGAREILVDLTEITHLDGVGIGALAEVAHIAHERGGGLYVCRAQGQPRDAIERSRARGGLPL